MWWSYCARSIVPGPIHPGTSTNLHCADVPSFQDTDRASSAGKEDEDGNGSKVENKTELYQQLRKLEEKVRLHRTLLEAEERLLYVDAIAELERIYQRLTFQRLEQKYRLTPWV
jgi:hypothetical protein